MGIEPYLDEMLTRRQFAVAAGGVAVAAAVPAKLLTGGDGNPPARSRPRARVRKTFDARDYGAHGQGGDYTAALQRALDAAGGERLHLPAGDYRSDSLFVSPGTEIVGDGSRTRLHGASGMRRHLLAPAGWEERQVADVVIRDLTLLGDSARQNGGGPPSEPADMHHGIALLRTRGWRIERVRANDFDGDGFYLGQGGAEQAPNGAHGNRIVRCSAVGNIRNGMMIATGTRNVISGCTLRGNQVGIDPRSPKYAPEFYKSAELDLEPNRQNAGGPDKVERNLIEHTTFADAIGIAIQITRPGFSNARNRISRCTFRDCEVGIAVFTPDADHLVVDGNRFVTTGRRLIRQHLRITQSSFVVVRGNRFLAGGDGDGGTAVISIDDAGTHTPSGVRFTGNVVDLRGGRGAGKVINVQGTKRTQIAGNRFRDAVVDNHDSDAFGSDLKLFGG